MALEEGGYEWHINTLHLCRLNKFFEGPRPYKQCNINYIETKEKKFRYRSLLSEQNQNVLIWSAYYRNKSERLHFKNIIEKRNQNF
jgi:hypothetical protein